MIAPHNYLTLARNMLDKANEGHQWPWFRLLLVLTSIAASLIAIGMRLEYLEREHFVRETL